MTVKEIKNTLDSTMNIVIYHNFDSKPLMATTLKDVDTWDNIEIESIGMSRSKRDVSLVIRLKSSSDMVYPVMFKADSHYHNKDYFYLDSKMDWIDYMDITVKPIDVTKAKALIAEEKGNYPSYDFIFVKAKHGEDKIDLKIRIEEEVKKARKVNQSDVK